MPPKLEEIMEVFLLSLRNKLEVFQNPTTKAPLKGAFFIGGAFFSILSIISFSLLKPNTTSIEYISAGDTLGSSNNKSITVEIAGAVVTPGVYRFDSLSRVGDLINSAGGFLTSADSEFINKQVNLARLLKDGEKIFVPFKGESNMSNSVKESLLILKININTASQAELETLPGIGGVYAKKIIDYRMQNGSFEKIEDIKKISGIGDTLFNKIEELIEI